MGARCSGQGDISNQDNDCQIVIFAAFFDLMSFRTFLSLLQWFDVKAIIVISRLCSGLRPAVVLLLDCSGICSAEPVSSSTNLCHIRNYFLCHWSCVEVSAGKNSGKAKS